MFSRFSISIGLALLFAFLFVFPASGGGWAVITLDQLPTGVIAGEPLTIGFTVLQHGRTPLSDLEPTVTANLQKDQEFVVHAEPDSEPGHYTATLTFPKEGEWRWSIQAFTMDQPMPALSVAPPGVVNQAATKPDSKPETVPWLMIIRGMIFGAALVGLVVAFRRKSRLAGALTGLCLLVGISTFITGATTLDVEAQSKLSSTTPPESASAQIELGQQLFVARGCITCHVNNKVERASEYWTIEMGAPDLTKFSGNEEVLRMRLKDPASVKSDTKMPNLGLKETEIEALIAFINSR